nr:unnamed protein product [Callosobruchus analis]
MDIRYASFFYVYAYIMVNKENLKMVNIRKSFNELKALTECNVFKQLKGIQDILGEIPLLECKNRISAEIFKILNVLTLCVLVGLVQARPQLRNTLQRLAGAIPSILRYDFDINGFGGFSYTAPAFHPNTPSE